MAIKEKSVLENIQIIKQKLVILKPDLGYEKRQAYDNIMERLNHIEIIMDMVETGNKIRKNRDICDNCNGTGRVMTSDGIDICEMCSGKGWL